MSLHTKRLEQATEGAERTRTAEPFRSGSTRTPSSADDRPVLKVDSSHADAALEMVELGWLTVIAKDDETRSVRLRLTPEGEAVLAGRDREASPHSVQGEH